VLPVVREPSCTTCDGPVVHVAWTQLPLLRHAGYGEAERTVAQRCVTPSCGSVRQVAVAAVNPHAVTAERRA
jgi:hypothetical protein